MKRARRRAQRALGTAALALVFALAPRVAHAADIAVVASDPNDPFVARVVRELEHLGLGVVRGSSVAASRDLTVLEVSEAGLDLHESLEGGTRKKRRLVASRRDAIEVAEEVHALLLPLVAKPPAPEPPPVAVAPTAAPPAPTADVAPPPPSGTEPLFGERSFELSAGAGAMIAAESPGLTLSFGASVYPRALRTRTVAFGASAGAWIAAAPESVSGSAGTADVRAYAGAAEAIARFGGAARFVADVALGVSVNHVTFAGSAVAPFTSRDESATSVSPTLRARATYAFGRVGFFLEARGGLAVPEIAVRFAGADVATWGRPWVSPGGGVAVGF